jgi:Na+-driven multidrug efflux pump
MLFSVSQAFGVATTSLVGRSVGADDYPMAEKYTSITKNTARVITVIMGILLFVFSRRIALLYTDDAEVLSHIAPVFIFMGMTHFFQSVQMSTSGALRGAGDTMYPLYACIIGIWIFRVSVCFLFVNIFGWGLTGAWFAFFLDQSTRAGVVVLRYRTGKWKGMKRLREAH